MAEIIMFPKKRKSDIPLSTRRQALIYSYMHTGISPQTLRINEQFHSSQLVEDEESGPRVSLLASKKKRSSHSN